MRELGAAAVLALLLAVSAFAADGKQTVDVYYFYVPACSSCEKTKDTLSGLDVKSADIASPDGQRKAEGFWKLYGVPEDKQTAPVVFAGDKAFVGADAINNDLIPYVTNGAAAATKTPVEGFGRGVTLAVGLVFIAAGAVAALRCRV